MFVAENIWSLRFEIYFPRRTYGGLKRDISGQKILSWENFAFLSDFGNKSLTFKCLHELGLNLGGV